MSSILIALLLPFTLGSFAPAQEARPEVGDEVARLNASVVQLFNEGKFDEGGKQARRALSLAEEGLGDRHELTAVARNNLARLYAVTGNHTAAEKHYRKALAVFVELRGADSLEAAAVHESLGQLELYGKRDPGRALKSYRRALDIREKVLGAEHDEVMRAARNVLRVYEVTQDWSEAEAAAMSLQELDDEGLIKDLGDAWGGS